MTLWHVFNASSHTRSISNCDIFHLEGLRIILKWSVSHEYDHKSIADSASRQSQMLCNRIIKVRLMFARGGDEGVKTNGFTVGAVCGSW